MRDKDARRRILYLENRVDRLENIIQDLGGMIGSCMYQDPLNSTCTKCNLMLRTGVICANKGDCPHGLDED